MSNQLNEQLQAIAADLFAQYKQLEDNANTLTGTQRLVNELAARTLRYVIENDPNIAVLLGISVHDNMFVVETVFPLIGVVTNAAYMQVHVHEDTRTPTPDAAYSATLTEQMTQAKDEYHERNIAIHTAPLGAMVGRIQGLYSPHPSELMVSEDGVMAAWLTGEYRIEFRYNRKSLENYITEVRGRIGSVRDHGNDTPG